MKIGILTFHWVTNYGAVAQAYALQKSLAQMGYDVEIIDYRPTRVILRNLAIRVVRRRLADCLKEVRLRHFRSRHLRTSLDRFRSVKALRRADSDYDVYICGSDQIWNESFIRRAERLPTLSYYLDFVDDCRRRVAYAASFGSEHLAPDTTRLVGPLLAKFHSIGVRENSGRSIVQAMGLDAAVVVDPTLLLELSDYEELIGEAGEISDRLIISYILHDDQGTAGAVLNSVISVLGGYRHISLESTVPDLEGWLRSLRDAEFVVTNSFHGVVFCLIFHTSFVVVPLTRAGSNDRIYTLLESIGLSDRVVGDGRAWEASELLERRICWGSVDDAIMQLRGRGLQFLRDALA